MFKKINLVLFAIILLSINIFFLTSCGSQDEVIKDGVMYQKARKTVDGITVECYYAYGCSDDIAILQIAEKINGLSVLGIKDEAFKNKTNLKEVVLPNSITSISLFTSYFLGCTNIEKLTLATDDVLNLFSDYGSANEKNTEPLPKSLKKIYLTSGCEKISARSFRYCKYLEELHIPSTVIKIEDGTCGTTIGVNGNLPNDDKFNDLPFLACENLTIFCENSTKPSGWDSYWNYINESTQLAVIWGNYN